MGVHCKPVLGELDAKGDGRRVALNEHNRGESSYRRECVPASALPEESMIDAAVQGIHRLFLATLLIVVIWFFGYFSAREKFVSYQRVEEFTKWTALHRTIANELPWDVFQEDAQKRLDTVSVVIGEQEAPNPGTPRFAPTAFEITVPWPTPKRYEVALAPVQSKLNPTNERIYEVITKPKLVNERWHVLFEKQEADDETGQLDGARASLKIGEIKLSGTERHIRGQFRTVETPPHWGEIALELAPSGFNGSWEELSPANSALARLQTEVDPRTGTVSIFGVELQSQLFLSTMGLLFAALAFSLFGPVLQLRRTTGPVESEPWILAVPVGEGRVSRLLEWVLIVLSAAWVVLPCFILVFQVISPRELLPAPTWVLVTGALALLFSSYAWAIAGWELYQLRRRGASPVEERREFSSEIESSAL